MTIVTNQTDLRNAITNNETDIQIANDIEISSTITISARTVSIKSVPNNQFTLLKSPALFGNMIRIQSDGNLTLSNMILDGNKENHPVDNITNRSLILLSGGTLIIQENTIIQNNNTYLEGGGVYLSGNAAYVNHFIMEDNAIIRGCYARTNGGGLVAAIRNNEDTIVIRNQSLFENNSANYGGGLYYRIYTEGISSSITLSDSPIFRNNSANNSGAAIAIFNIANNSRNIHFVVPDTSLISHNNAINHGAGIYFVGTNSDDQLDVGTATIQNNNAGGYGGAIYTSWVLTNLNGTTISQNKAGTGGGLYILTNNGGTLNITSASIQDNEATNGASGAGGGIWINNRSTTLPYTMQISDTSISNNSASAQGGGVYVSERSNGFYASIENVEIQNNIAGTNGGGMLLASAGLGNIQIQKSNISNNTSNNYGGGVYISNEANGTTTTLISDSVISNNQANVQGGGLRLASGLGIIDVSLENCSVEKNIAQTSSGGGIWCGGNNANLSLTQTTTVNQNETIDGHGGGIYFNSQNGILKLTDNVQINNNLAIQNPNSTGNHGGGIYLVPGTLFMTGNSEISGNEAKYGGGIGASEQSTVTIENGTIHNNKAIDGGGIHNQSSTVYIQGGNIYDNSANIGGGIYNGSSLYISDNASIYGNEATSIAPGIYNGGDLYAEDSIDIENGVYIEDRTSVVNISNALTSNTIIQIDLSNYVAPDESLAPIIIAQATDTYPILNEIDLLAFRKPQTEFEEWELQLAANNTQIVLVPRYIEEYTITYQNLHGASHTNPPTYTSETPTIILTAPTHVKCNYFIGWFNESGINITTIPQGTTGNIVLTARWDKIGCYDKIGYICIPKKNNLK